VRYNRFYLRSENENWFWFWKSGLKFINLDNQRIFQQLSDLTKLYSRLERYNELFENNLEGEIGFQSQDEE